MRIRLALALAAALTLPAFGPVRAEPGSWADAPDKLPRAPRGDRFKNLDFLFEALKAAPDADSAKLVEGRSNGEDFESRKHPMSLGFPRCGAIGAPKRTVKAP